MRTLAQVYIIEANPRASRTVPFVAKAIGHPLAAYASLLMSGQTLGDLGFTEEPVLNHVAVKEAVLPFEKFAGARPARWRARLVTGGGCTVRLKTEHIAVSSGRHIVLFRRPWCRDAVPNGYRVCTVTRHRACTSSC